MRTKDITPPVLASGYPQVSKLDETSLDLLLKTAEAGTVYCKVLSGAATAPTAAEVITDNNRKTITAGSEESMSVNALSPGTTYDVYLMLDNSSPVPVHKYSGIVFLIMRQNKTKVFYGY